MVRRPRSAAGLTLSIELTRRVCAFLGSLVRSPCPPTPGLTDEQRRDHDRERRRYRLYGKMILAPDVYL